MAFTIKFPSIDSVLIQEVIIIIILHTAGAQEFELTDQDSAGGKTFTVLKSENSSYWRLH